MRRAIAALLAAVLAAVPAHSAAAQTGFGQTFTAPAAPNILLQNLTVGPTGFIGSAPGPTQFRADIFAFSGGPLGLPVGPSLFSQLLGTSIAGFTLTPNLALTPGGTYVVLVALPSEVGTIVTIDLPADVYGGGSFANCGPLFCAQEVLGRDLAGFAVQFGPAATVPEPGTWALLGTGLLALGGVAARRKRAA
jgi:hypothetical protein